MYEPSTKRIPCTWQNILRVGGWDDIQLRIINEVMGYMPQISEFAGQYKYRNTLRGDRHPGCWYTRKANGLIILIDYADLTFHKATVFDLMMIKSQTETYTIKTFSEVLQVINEKYFLGLGTSNSTEIKPKTFPKSQPRKKDLNVKHGPKEIRVFTEEFSEEAYQYWEQFGIDLTNLGDEEERIVEVSSYFIESENGVLEKDGKSWTMFPTVSLTFAYLFPESDKVKIYAPNHKNFERKWMTNCGRNDIFGFYSIPQRGDRLIISKSWKDMMCLRSMGYQAIAFQNEGMGPDKKIVDSLKKRFNAIVILFDGDEAGAKAAEKLGIEYDLPWETIGDDYYKDVAEMFKAYGEEYVKEIIENKFT